MHTYLYFSEDIYRVTVNSSKNSSAKKIKSTTAFQHFYFVLSLEQAFRLSYNMF